MKKLLIALSMAALLCSSPLIARPAEGAGDGFEGSAETTASQQPGIQVVDEAAQPQQQAADPESKALQETLAKWPYLTPQQAMEIVKLGKQWYAARRRLDWKAMEAAHHKADQIRGFADPKDAEGDLNYIHRLQDQYKAALATGNWKKAFKAASDITDYLSGNDRFGTPCLAPELLERFEKDIGRLKNLNPNPVSEVSEAVAQNALEVAQKYAGGGFPYDPYTENGNLGCANVVSAILKAAGVPVWSLGCTELRRQLLAIKAPDNWTEVQPPPYEEGDVVIWAAPNGSIHHHVGVVVQSGNSLEAVNNHSGPPAVVGINEIEYRPVQWVLRKG